MENIFVKLGRFLIAYPKTALFFIFLEFVLLAAQLPHLRIDTSIEKFLSEDSPQIIAYDQFREVYGRDEFFVVAIVGQPVLDFEFLQTLKQFHAELEQRVDRLQSVESLVNVRSIYGEEDDLIAEDLLEELPNTPEDIPIIKERIRGKPIYYGRLINETEDAVTLLVKLVPYIKDPESGELINLGDAQIMHGYHQILEIAEQYEARFGEAKIYVGGTPASGSYMSRVIQEDFGIFTSVALLMVIFVLWSLFKRLSGVIIPIVVMAVGITTTIAMMPVLGFPMQITTSIIPSFLLAVCIGDAVHLLSGFYHYYDQGSSKRSAILASLNHTGVAVMFTSLTTAAGLLTFAFSEIMPIASLGLFAAIGSILAFFITVIGLPVLLHLCPIKRKAYVDIEKMDETGLPYKFTRFCIEFSTTYPKSIVAVALIIGGAALTIIPNIRFAQDSLEWFPDDTPVKVAVKTIEKTITGSMPVEIVIDTGVEHGVKDPEFLAKMNGWLSDLSGNSFNDIPIMSVNSIVDLVKETNQAFNGNNMESYIVPDNQELIAQELLLVEMDQADDLFEYTDSNYRNARVTLIIPWVDAIMLSDFMAQLDESYYRHMGEGYGYTVTGVIPIFNKMFTAMIMSAAQSYLIAAVAISFMMILLMRGLVDGLLSMIPNLLPIMMVLSYMVIVDLPLDIFTVLIGSVALGLSVDDTVHFMHGFKTVYAKCGDAKEAIEKTLLSTGKALMITSIVLFFGFMTFTLSGLQNMDIFGILTAMCIVLAFLADFIVAPAIMYLRYNKKAV